MSQKFRYDINGLRAYAVALVVLFHFGVFGFTGGFIGVDVFFVISGFLMTSIIVKGLENKTFNFLKFYLSRANRIIPALFALCVVVGLVGWFTLTPQELKDYAKHAITSLGFISNIQYFKEAGYFDATSHEKLLLHTWSLSVEWQFYILLPIFLFLAYRIKQSKSVLKIAFTGLFVVSLILALYLTPKMPSASFFLLPTRAWEMLAGGLIFLFFNKISLSQQRSTIVELIGFSLIAISVIYFTGSTPWPSYNAILPVLGAFLILLASNQNSLLTNNKIAQFLGNTSYSIYLWHWPLVFYLSYLEKSSDTLWIMGAILLSVILGWLSYKYIENPSRKFLSNLSLIKGYIVTFIYITIPMVIFALIFIKNGVPNRLPTDVKIMAILGEERRIKADRCSVSPLSSLRECKMGTGDVKLILIGDSHAESIAKALEKSLPKESSLIDLSLSGCPTVENIKRTSNPGLKCGSLVTKFIDRVKDFSDVPILITARTNILFFPAPEKILSDTQLRVPTFYITRPFDHYSGEYYQTMKNAYIDTLCKFAEHHTVYVTTPTPEYKINIAKTLIHRKLLNSNERIYITKAQHLSRSQFTYEAQIEASKKCGIKILDVNNVLCDSEKCYADKNNIPLYYDTNHLNLYGSDQLIPLFKTIFN